MSNRFCQHASKESFSLSDGTTLTHCHLSGSVHLSVPICSIQGPYGPLSLSLCWRSDVEAGLFAGCQLGLGYYLDIGMRLSVSASAVDYIDALEEAHRFPGVALGDVACDQYGSGLLLRPLSSGYEVFDGFGFRALFSASGRLLSAERHLAGVAHATQFSYDQQGRPTSVSDPSGRSLSISYTSSGCVVTLPDSSTVTVSLSLGVSNSVTWSTGETVTITSDDVHRPIAAANEDGESLSFAYSGEKLASVEKKRGGLSLLKRVYSRDGTSLSAVTLLNGRTAGGLLESVYMDDNGRRAGSSLPGWPLPLFTPDLPHEELRIAPSEQNSADSGVASTFISLDTWVPYSDLSLSFPARSMSTSGDEELRLCLVFAVFQSLPGPLSIDVLSPSGNSLLADGPSAIVASESAGQFQYYALRLTSTQWQTSLTLRVSKDYDNAASVILVKALLCHVRKKSSFSAVKDPSGPFLEPQGSKWSLVRSAIGSPPSGGQARFWKEDLEANSLLLLRGSQKVFADRLTRLVPSNTPTSVNGGATASYSSFSFGTIGRDGAGLAYSHADPATSSIKTTVSSGPAPFKRSAVLSSTDYSIWPLSETAEPGEIGASGATKTYSYGQDGLLSSERVSSLDGDMLRSRTVSAGGSFFQSEVEDFSGVSFEEKAEKSTGLLSDQTVGSGPSKTFLYGQRGRLTQMDKGIWRNRVSYTGGLATAFRLTANTVHIGRAFNTDGTLSSETVLGSGADSYTYQYQSSNQTNVAKTFANGDSASATTDARGLVIERSFGSEGYSYTYDSAGNLTQIDEGATTVRALSYDAQDRLVDDGGLLKLTYSGYGRVSSQKVFYPDYTSQSSPSYDSSGALKSDAFLAKEGVLHLSFSRDSLGRPTGESARLTLPDSSYGPEYGSSVTYLSRPFGAETLTTPLPSLVSYEKGGTPDGSVAYTYDSKGRVSTVSVDGALAHSFFYDDAGRLVRDDDAGSNRTWTYAFSLSGNVTTKTERPYQSTSQKISDISYSYSSGRLTSLAGETISYDSSGNPLNWRGAALTYCRGHLLKTYEKGGKTITFEYNEDGTVRKKFSRPSAPPSLITVTEYYYGGGRLLYERTRLGSVVTRTVRYLYSLERLVGFELGGETYLYRYDAQGSVIAVLSASNGAAAARYDYGAWGDCRVVSDSTASGAGSKNPIRFKGYYWDEDVGLYRLGERLYDPSVGRFLQPDCAAYADPTVPFGLNMYAYCLNDPVNYADPDGRSAILALILIGLGIIAAEAVIGAIGYAVWDSIEWISAENGNISIKHSWLIRNEISRAVFLALMYSNSEYQSTLANSGRSYFSYLLEWDLHNAAADVLFIAGIVTFIPSSLASDPWITNLLWGKFGHAASVDMEPGGEWWKNMWGSLFK